MKRFDQGTGLFWLFFSISVCIESVRLGIGTLSNPGMGFMAFGTSILLGFLSIILFLKGSLKKDEAKTEPQFAGKLWKRAFLVLGALTIYARLMPVAGYLIGTFIFMTFIFWIATVKKWWWILVSSFLTTLITYYVFSVMLQCQFPEGLFQF